MATPPPLVTQGKLYLLHPETAILITTNPSDSKSSTNRTLFTPSNPSGTPSSSTSDLESGKVEVGTITAPAPVDLEAIAIARICSSIPQPRKGGNYELQGRGWVLAVLKAMVRGEVKKSLEVEKRALLQEAKKDAHKFDDDDESR
ncbi:MAG: hypothetical protein Q9164_000737, partial [Protoblastenia rupestris]